KSELALNEGYYYLYSNIGWLFGPLIAGYAAKIFGNESVFIITSICFSIVLIYFLQQKFIPDQISIKNKEKFSEILSNFKNFFGNIELRKVFIISLGLNFWWAISWIYIPLSVENLGFNQDVVGLVMSGGILPLILLEGWVGKRADKKGIRLYILFGFMFLSVVTLLFPSASKYPIILFILFALVNIGAAFIEPLTEVYFFKTVKCKNRERFFGTYTTAGHISNIFGPIIGSLLIILNQNMNTLWIGTSFILFLFFLQSTKIKV
ncbi:MFS transporter, partial [Pseudomonadota bacterium]